MARELVPEHRIKAKLARILARRFFLRFHVTLILLWTWACGLLATHWLLLSGLYDLSLRYPLAVLIAYLAFALAIRVWLTYVDLGRYVHTDKDVPNDFPSGHADHGSAFEPGGGSFGGGGATGDYADIPAPDCSPGIADAVSLDEGCLPALLLAAVLALAAAAIGGAVWIAAQVPAILLETAFEALLAAGLIKATRRVAHGDWFAVVWRMTRWPFLLVLIGAFAIGLYAKHYTPTAHTIVQVLRDISK